MAGADTTIEEGADNLATHDQNPMGRDTGELGIDNNRGKFVAATHGTVNFVMTHVAGWQGQTLQ